MGKIGFTDLKAGQIITFMYTNWKGRKAKRSCVIEGVGFGRSEYHNATIQWFLNGHDLDKQTRRSYALVDIETDTIEVDTTSRQKWMDRK